MTDRARRRSLKATQQKQLEAALIHELRVVARDCCDLLDRANAALKSALVTRQNHDKEIRRQMIEELSALYNLPAEIFIEA